MVLSCSRKRLTLSISALYFNFSSVAVLDGFMKSSASLATTAAVKATARLSFVSMVSFGMIIPSPLVESTSRSPHCVEPEDCLRVCSPV